MKIAVIGGGSTYTPELIDGFIKYKNELPLAELALVDIDRSRLNIIAAFARRMLKEAGLSIKILATTNRLEGLSGADFVITQIRVGGNQARHRDTLIALKHGIIGQETTGAAGFAKGMRTIPVMLEICKDISQVAPNAWLINFTNPSGMITEAIYHYGYKRVIGLCNWPECLKQDLAAAFEVDTEQIFLDYFGLNHLSWVRKVYLGSRDVTAEALSHWRVMNLPKNIPSVKEGMELLVASGYIPNPYLRYYYLTENILKQQQQKIKTRAQEVMEIEKKLIRLYQDVNLKEKPPELEERGGAFYSTAAVKLICDLVNDARRVHIINIPMKRELPGYKPYNVIETPALVGGPGVFPLVVELPDATIETLIRQIKTYEELTIEAALQGDYDIALQALTVNPLVREITIAKKVLDHFLEVGSFKLKKSSGK